MIKNFFSFGNTPEVIKFDEHNLTLVLGHNLDTNNSDTNSRNGAGKSSIVQALCYVFFGNPIGKIKVDRLINNINKKAMLVVVEFELNGVEYRIERGRKPNIFKFFKNEVEWEDESLGENRHTQEAINNLIGLNDSIFPHVIAMTTEVDPFLKMRAADQREVIESLLGVTQLSQKADVLTKLMANTKNSARDERARVSAIQEANKRIEEAINKANAEIVKWDDHHQSQIKELSQQIFELDTVDFEKELQLLESSELWEKNHSDSINNLKILNNSLSQTDNDILRINKEIKDLVTISPNVISVDRYEIDNNNINNKISKIKDRQDELSNLILIKKQEIDNDDHNCMTCGQKINNDHLETIKNNLSSQLNDLEMELNNNPILIQGLLDEIKKNEEDIVLIHSTNENNKKILMDKRGQYEMELGPLMLKKEEIENQIETIHISLDHDAQPKAFFEDKNEYYQVKALMESTLAQLESLKDKINPHIDHLNSLQNALQEVNWDTYNELDELLKHQEFLLRLLTNKESFVRKRIIDQNLFYLNQRLTHYLQIFYLPHEIIFQNDLTVDISLLGIEYDYEQLSRGERARVIMAVGFAFRDVWESLNYSCNLMWIDELADSGADSQFGEATLSQLKHFSRQGKNVFWISHKEELKGRIDRTIMVVKENGFSSIEEDN